MAFHGFGDDVDPTVRFVVGERNGVGHPTVDWVVDRIVDVRVIGVWFIDVRVIGDHTPAVAITLFDGGHEIFAVEGIEEYADQRLRRFGRRTVRRAELDATRDEVGITESAGVVGPAEWKWLSPAPRRLNTGSI